MPADLSVLLVVGDALRRDALLMEHPPGEPTAMTRRVKNWLRFDHCYSAAPWTLPSSTGLLTGEDALVHGKHSFRYELTTPTIVGQLPVGRRAAVVNNSVLTRPSGLAEDFDEYYWVPDSGETFVKAKEVLAARRADGESFFVMVHSNIPHDYFMVSSRREYERYFPDRDDYLEIRYRVLTWKGIEAKGATVRRVYDACVLRLHDEIESLLETVDYDATIVIVTADHGEGFEPERARIHHGGRVHDDLVRIPFVMWIPPTVPPATRARLEQAARAPMSSIDLLPTLFGLLGAPAPEGLRGRDLTAAADGNANGAARVIRIEDRHYLYLRTRLRLNTNAKGKNMTRVAKARNRVWRSTVARQHSIQGFVQGHHKLIVTEFVTPSSMAARAGAPFLRRVHIGEPFVVVRDRSWYGCELFDLEADPQERTNLLRRPGRSREQLTTRLLETIDAFRRGDSAPTLTDLAGDAAA